MMHGQKKHQITLRRPSQLPPHRKEWLLSLPCVCKVITWKPLRWAELRWKFPDDVTTFSGNMINPSTTHLSPKHPTRRAKQLDCTWWYGKGHKCYYKRWLLINTSQSPTELATKSNYNTTAVFPRSLITFTCTIDVTTIFITSSFSAFNSCSYREVLSGSTGHII